MLSAKVQWQLLVQPLIVHWLKKFLFWKFSLLFQNLDHYLFKADFFVGAVAVCKVRVTNSVDAPHWVAGPTTKLLTNLALRKSDVTQPRKVSYLILDLRGINRLKGYLYIFTFFQSSMNDKLIQRRFWPWHENNLIKTIQTIPWSLYVSFKSACLY